MAVISENRKAVSMHGVKYYRTGSCNRCGACEKDKCPHFSMADELACCKIHSKKGTIL
jgi:hypothetical protein